jgi:Uma2 family endonuclease
MASPAPHRKYTIAEYVRLEAYANVKHEFLEGQIYAMAGGTREHGARAANVITLLNVALRGRPCQAHTSDVRIRIRATGLDTYPDVSVVCGAAEHDSDDVDAITNPIVIVEVLSPSTEQYDRGEKLEHYKKIPALQEVVFVAHDEPRVDVLRRRPDGSWSSSQGRSGERMPLQSLGVELDVAEVFRDPLATPA